MSADQPPTKRWWLSRVDQAALYISIFCVPILNGLHKPLWLIILVISFYPAASVLLAMFRWWLRRRRYRAGNEA